MSRVVLDTNILFSALVFGGVPRRVLQLAEEGRFAGVISEHLLSELRRALNGKTDWDQFAVKAALRRLSQYCLMLDPDSTVSACRDADDNHVLALAVYSGASCIVTGDRDLLDLHPFRGIDILRPTEFLARIGA